MKDKGTPRGMDRFRILSQDEFAARCRAARAYADMKMDEVAKLMGITRQALSRRENGLVAIPIPDRYVMATVLCELTDWPEEVFTSERWPVVEVAADDLEPAEVAHLVERLLSDAEQP